MPRTAPFSLERSYSERSPSLGFFFSTVFFIVSSLTPRGSTSTDNSHRFTAIRMSHYQDSIRPRRADCNEALLRGGMIWVGIGPGQSVTKNGGSLLEGNPMLLTILPRPWPGPIQISQLVSYATLLNPATTALGTGIRYPSQLHYPYPLDDSRRTEFVGPGLVYPGAMAPSGSSVLAKVWRHRQLPIRKLNSLERSVLVQPPKPPKRFRQPLLALRRAPTH